MMQKTVYTISVIICAYTERRWSNLVDAVESVRQQTLQASEIIVVIDHNPQLLQRVKDTISDVIVVDNTIAQGYRSARDCGIAMATGQILAFLDDDARANSDWLEFLCSGYEDMRVIGTGGLVVPLWLSEPPGWFPEEFYWVVGCTYRGMPRQSVPIRNPIGANMSIHRKVFEVVGTFYNGVDELGPKHVCDETELCVRASQYWPESIILYQPEAQVSHCVSRERTSWHYFCRRCYVEGSSKAVMANSLGAKDTLSVESSYALRVLPLGVLANLFVGIYQRDATRFMKAGAILIGLALTVTGYIVGMCDAYLTNVKNFLLSIPS